MDIIFVLLIVVIVGCVLAWAVAEGIKVKKFDDFVFLLFFKFNAFLSIVFWLLSISSFSKVLNTYFRYLHLVMIKPQKSKISGVSKTGGF